MDNYDSDTLTEIPFGLAGRIYRSPMPYRPGDENGELINHFQQAGIQTVILLMPRHEYLEKSGRDLAGLYHQNGMQVVEMPIQDYSTPDLAFLEKALEETIVLARSGKNIVIHCYAGFGRTGTFLACLAVRLFNLTGQQAIDWVRQYVPPALENEDQTRFVGEYGDHHADHKR